MLFSAQLPLASLIELCRALRHNLSAGLTLRDVFRQQATRGSAAVRPVAERIRQQLDRGDDLERALKQEKSTFPPLFLALAGVGERTGCLPEVFAELEKYFTLQQKLQRQFYAQIAWPVFQLCAAIGVITVLLWALGFVASLNPGQQALDPLGLGLTGASGALIFLMLACGCVAGVLGLYLLATRLLKQQAVVDAALLSLPVIGSCLHALALGRFCLALRLTLETGMAITSALRLSLRATGNAAYVARTEGVLASLREGDDLTLALATARLFPEEFQNIIATAEESGRLSEVLRHQADYYEEEASRRLRTLTAMAGYAVWLAVATLIIIAIFRLAFFYLGVLDKVMEPI